MSYGFFIPSGHEIIIFIAVHPPKNNEIRVCAYIYLKSGLCI
jgi:hypothetical protein